MGEPMTPSPIHATCAMLASSIRGPPTTLSPALPRLLSAVLVLDGLGGECELLACAPIVGHVIDDDRLAHAVDLAPLEAVVGDVGGHEYERRIALEGRAADVALVRIVDIGPERGVARILRCVEQHREQLDAKVGV